MHLPSHLVIGWFVGESQGLANSRDRRIVALAGIAPDIDAVAYLAAIVGYGFDRDRAFQEVWQPVHHYYCKCRRKSADKCRDSALSQNQRFPF